MHTDHAHAPEPLDKGPADLMPILMRRGAIAHGHGEPVTATGEQSVIDGVEKPKVASGGAARPSADIATGGAVMLVLGWNDSGCGAMTVYFDRGHALILDAS